MSRSVNPRERLRLVAAWFKLDLRPPESVVDAAVGLLDELPTNEALSELAATKPFREDVTEALSRTLAAEGMAVPSDEEAGRLVARDVAAAIVRGDIGPVDGARLIWWDIVRGVPALEGELLHFVGMASEWEDDVAHRAEYEAEIREAAAELVQG